MNEAAKILLWLKQRSRWHDPLAIAMVIAAFLALTKNNIATIETAIFLGLMILVLWWRIDGRIPVAAALIGLVITAVSNTLFNNDLWETGEIVAERVAVWVFFLLVIGVARLMWESRQDT